MRTTVNNKFTITSRSDASESEDVEQKEHETAESQKFTYGYNPDQMSNIQ